MPSQYYREVRPLRRDSGANDVQRGMQIGQEVGKMLGGLSAAIKSSQKDALANKLMTDQSISEQPGAGQTMSLGKLGGDGSSSGDGSGGGAPGSPQDLGSLPADQTFTNPATGDIQSLQDPNADADLSQAIAAARLGSGGPSVGSVGSPQPGGPQPGGPQPASGNAPDFSIDQGSLAPSGPTNTRTVGDLMHTGGAQEMDLQEKMLGQQIQKANLTKTLAKETPNPLDVAQKRATLAKTLAEVKKAQAPAAVKNPPPVDIANEPVTDQNQLNNYIDSIYGKNAASHIAATLNVEPTIPDPNNPGQTIPNPDPSAPVVTGNSVTVGPKNKRITMPLAQAQIYAKQYNAMQIKQGLPPVRVPGESLTVGATAGDSYIAKSNLDVWSRAPGTWVRLPNGKIAQVPQPKRPQ